MDHVTPRELVADAVELAGKKSELSIRDLLIRGAVAGALLGIATSLAFVAVAQGLPPLVGAIIFPVGFVMLVVFGQELATGNFALLPMGMMAGKVRFSPLIRNWAVVYLGNLIGSLLYAALFWLSLTNCGRSDGGAMAELVRQAAQKKTLGFMALGASGWTTALVRAMLCNWMVTVGTLLSLASVDDRKSDADVASHHDFLCAGLRARHREHVRDSRGDVAGSAGFDCEVVAVEPDSGDSRKHCRRRAVHCRSAVCDVFQQAGIACCRDKDDRTASRSGGRLVVLQCSAWKAMPRSDRIKLHRTSLDALFSRWRAGARPRSAS